MPSVLFIPTQRTHVDAFAPLLHDTSLRQAVERADVLTSISGLTADEIGGPDHLYSFDPLGLAQRSRLGGKFAVAVQTTNWWLDVGASGSYSLIIVGNDGGGFQKVLIHQARRAGTPSLLLQDGMLRNAVHPPMAQPLRATRSRLLRKLASLNQHVSSFPGNAASFAGVYGESTKRTFTANGFPATNVYVVGSPRHRELRNKVAALRRTMVVEHKLEVLFLPSNQRRTGQHALAKAEDEYLMQLMEQTQEVNNATTARVAVTVKPHPRESVSDYQWLLDAYPKSIEVVDPDSDYATVLAQADAVFGMYSTGLLDAAVAGCVTVQLLPSRLRGVSQIPGIVAITDARQARDFLLGLAAGTSDPNVTPDALGDEIADAFQGWDSVAACVNLILSLSDLTPRTNIGKP